MVNSRAVRVADTTPTGLRVADLSVAYGGPPVLTDLSLEIAPGELVALLGPSGCGKTTLLRSIAGLERPTHGTISVGGRVVTGNENFVPPERRRIGMVFQDGALFPHLTVTKNVAFGGPAAGRVEECLELVGLAHRGDAFPHELSGGERQRIALARALATDPAVVLLDEPFASLDAGLRVALREEVAAILRRAGASALLVTHDQQEAMSLADHVVIMRSGRVAQSGVPEDAYLRPADRWVADFLGDAVVLPGRVDGDRVATALGAFPVAGTPSGDVDVLLRPEAIRLTAPGVGDTAAPRGTVTQRVFYGHDQLFEVRLVSGEQVHCRATGLAPWRPGDDVVVVVDGGVHVLGPDGG